MSQATPTPQILKAFKSAVDSYVPSQNKNAWNSDGTDKIAQLIKDSVTFKVSSFKEIADNVGVQVDAVEGWASGTYVPKPRIRFKVKEFLSKKCSLALKCS